MQLLPSSQARPTSGVWKTPLTGSQPSIVQGFSSSTAGAVPDTQAPAPSRVSSPLQASPSAQAVPAAAGGWSSPVMGSHRSRVQGSESSTSIAAPGWQAPAASQASPVVQTSPSSQARPSWTACDTPVTASQVSTVQGSPSSVGSRVATPATLVLKPLASGSCRWLTATS
ncbi:MAG: hypothetical protein OXT09_34090 [Myxococcales bacterium]|nr:hypothetical protein [Myxococcales bacterium]